jgi:hypothetical protein
MYRTPKLSRKRQPRRRIDLQIYPFGSEGVMIVDQVYALAMDDFPFLLFGMILPSIVSSSPTQYYQALRRRCQSWTIISATCPTALVT